MVDLKSRLLRAIELVFRVLLQTMEKRFAFNYKWVAQLHYFSKRPQPNKQHKLGSLDKLLFCIQFAFLPRFFSCIPQYLFLLSKCALCRKPTNTQPFVSFDK